MRFPESNTGEDTAFALAVLARGGKLWYDPGIAVTHRHERLDWDSFWEKQVACGRTIYETRAKLDRPGKVARALPAAALPVSRTSGSRSPRMARAGHAGQAVTLFPWLFTARVARIRGSSRRGGGTGGPRRPRRSGRDDEA